jgi:hypothetical protein
MVLSVRIPRITCQETYRKYRDIDTGKVNLDKMESIKPLSWADLISEEVSLRYAVWWYRNFKERTIDTSENFKCNDPIEWDF